MTFEEIKALDERYVMQTYGRNQLAIDHGRGKFPQAQRIVQYGSRGVGYNKSSPGQFHTFFQPVGPVCFLGK